VFADAWL